MDDRTRTYLRGRFRDYYRRNEIDEPPEAESREWGFIPFTESPGSTMVRHESLLSYESLDDLLRKKAPRHMYFSAGKYDSPSDRQMREKGWQGSDLVFDLDADHLDSVNLGEDSYAEMLEKCKQELKDLLVFLEDDFEFDDMTIVFSGGRGYHVHIRDASVQELEREHRREIVDYVRGQELDFEKFVKEDAVAVSGYQGRETNAGDRYLDIRGGWGRHIRDHLAEILDIRDMDDEEAREYVTQYDGIGENRAEAVISQARENYTEIVEDGNLNVSPVVYTIVRGIIDDVIADKGAHIDEPVTTDTNRLIRLPESLHGGSSLAVRHIPRDELDDFDPLVDAVPDVFTSMDVTVTVEDGGQVEMNGEKYHFEDGETATVPECVAMFLMARGRAVKAEE